MTAPQITTRIDAPLNSDMPDIFSNKAEAMGLAINPLGNEINAVAVFINDRASDAQQAANDADVAKSAAEIAAERAESSAANVSEVWSAAKDYVLGARVFVESPAEYSKYTYRRRVPGVSATPPYNDTTNWVRINGIYAELSIALAANSDLNAVITSGFYRLSTGHTNAPTGVNNGQMLVSRGSGSIMQIVTDNAGAMHWRSGAPSSVGGGGSWSPWQRALGDLSVLERHQRHDGLSYLKTDPALGSITTIVASANLNIEFPRPRSAGDQFTLRIIPSGGLITFVGAPVFFGVGVTMPQAGVGQALTLGFISRRDANGWDIFVGGIHP